MWQWYLSDPLQHPSFAQMNIEKKNVNRTKIKIYRIICLMRKKQVAYGFCRQNYSLKN